MIIVTPLDFAVANWKRIVAKLFSLRLLRKRFGLLGRFLGQYHPDRTTCRRHREWWHIVGLHLQKIKARGEGRDILPRVPSIAPRFLAEHGFPETQVPEPEPDQEPSPPTSTGGASSSTSQVNVQVNITIDNARTTVTGSGGATAAGGSSSSGGGSSGRHHDRLGGRRGRGGR